MKKRWRKHLSIWTGTCAYILFLLACILLYAIDYITNVIQVESFSQFLYTMQVGMGGASNTIVQILQGFAQTYLIWIIIATILYACFLHLFIQEKHAKKSYRFSNTVLTLNSAALVASVITAGTLVYQVKQGYKALKIDEYFEEQNIVSTLYEDHYTKTDSSLVQFPKKKKNLIYIYLESMESTYADKEHGGEFVQNLIPHLTQLANDNVDFSENDSLMINGGQVTNNTSWTVAGMVAQTSGTPLGVSNSKYNHSFDEDMLFMPNVVSLGDLLKEQGYSNTLMCGSEASYAGRANYFRQHGDYTILDLNEAHESGKLPKDYHEWWGFEDSKLIEFAKEEITELAKQDQPFNFTMLTADTHFKDGYLCEDCPDTFDEQYENVIMCSDQRIAEFVHWIQQQDFYQDTVIVLAGDHLSMDGLINQEVGLDCQRKTYFTVINGPDYTLNKTRSYTTLDIFPTTVEALGAQIEGDHLGLGTSLYADAPTLSEEFGFEWLNKQISYHNVCYEQEIMEGDGLDVDGNEREETNMTLLSYFMPKTKTGQQ